MAVKYILEQTGYKMGLDPVDGGQRAVLLRFLNEAAVELYEQADIEGVLKEQVFLVDGNQQIVLPYYVGPLRAMREVTTYVPWRMHTMRPRYNQSNWQDRWRNWRLKGCSATVAPVTNASILTATVSATETPYVIVSVTGPTNTASSTSEQIVMSSTSVDGVLAFSDITALKKDRINGYDITIKDVDGNTISVIPNNMLQAKYRLVDVSLYPWSTAATDATNHYMEVLYKDALPWLNNDDDEFPALGYDNIIVNKMLQLWSEEQGKTDQALAYDAKATRSFARKNEDETRGTEEVVGFVEHPHDNLLLKNRSNRPSRYTRRTYY